MTQHLIVPHYNFDILQELLHFKNNNAETALHVACRAGHLNIIKKIFEEVDPTIQDELLSILLPSILRLALKFGRHNISCYLQNRSIPFDTDSNLESKHFHSGRCNHIMDFDIPGPRLCNICMSDDERRFQQVPYASTENMMPWILPYVPSLNLACRNGDHHTVKFLIKAHKYDPKQEGALHSACVSSNVDLVTYLVSECGCDPNLCDANGNTALHEACKWGCLSIVKFFINRDPAILNIKNYKKETPLHLACFHSRVLICEFLAGFKECEIIAKNSMNETPLHIAAYHPHSSNKSIIKCLISKCDTGFDFYDKLGDTPLFNACRAGNLEIIELLIEAGSNPFYINNKTKEMPVHIACRLCRKDILEVFLKYCDDLPINHANVSGQTLLHLACIKEDLDIVDFLLDHSCDPNVADRDGKTPLHIACSANNVEIAACLLRLKRTCLDAKGASGHTALQYAENSDGNTAIHIACAITSIKLLKTLLTTTTEMNFDVFNNDGMTPLHIACCDGDPDLVSYLIEGKYCSPNCITKEEKNTPLHVACQSGNLSIVQLLVTCLQEATAEYNSSGLPPVFLAHRNYEIVAFLVPQYCDPNIKSKEGLPLFHQVCINGNRKLVEYLVVNARCDPTVLGPFESTAIHTLLKDSHCDNSHVLKYLLEVCHSQKNSKDESGNAPIHIACMSNNFDAVNLLLTTKSSEKIDLSQKNGNDNTPIQLTRKYKIIKLLIGHGANPQDVYEYCGNILERCKEEQPLHNIVKIFVVGNAFVGKTTLVEALKCEGIETKLVQKVENRTTGIVQSEFKSEVFGRVSFNDFAGQQEFYSSHSQFLANAPLSQAVVLIVINMLESEAQISESLKYWVSFVTSQCTNRECIPKLIFIGSHIDELLCDSNRPSKMRALKKMIKSSKSSQFDPLFLDCRSPVSVEINVLRELLSIICSTLRRNVQLDCRCHVLFAFLHSHFPKQNVVDLSELVGKIRKNRLNPHDFVMLRMYSHTHRVRLPGVSSFVDPLADRVYYPDSDDEPQQVEPRQVELLPYVTNPIVDLLKNLSRQGHILLLKCKSEEDKYWIILNQDVLYHNVHGTLFAPDSFSTRPKQSNVGVLPLLSLEEMFSSLDIDFNVIIHYLVYCEFCHKIEDPETLHLISRSTDVTQTTSVGDATDFFFFPCFIKIDKPGTVWKTRDEQVYCSGWCLQCVDFFPNTFLHVLLLRLTFKYAVSTSSTSGSFPFNRKCDIWKNGIHWCTRKGIEVLVELTHNLKFLVFLIRPLNKGEDTCTTMECVKLRASVIKTVFDVLEKTCPGVETSEHLIHHDLQQYPECDLMSAQKVDIAEIAETIKSGERFVFGTSNEPIDLEDMLYFEPYANIGETLLASFYDEDVEQNIIQSKDAFSISPCFLRRKNKMIRMLNVADADLCELEKIPACQTNQSLLILHIIEQWRTDKQNGGGKGSFSDLRETFDQYSIFNGRNPLLLSKCKKQLQDPTMDDHYES